MSKKCALSFKKDREGLCNTIVNGKLRVKQTARIEKTLAVEDNLQVYNNANIGDTVNTCNITIKNQLIYSEPELINESGETLSQLKSLSFINTNGDGELEDGCCNGLYKQIVKINDGTTASEWETLSDINGTVHVVVFDEFNNDEGPYIGGNFTSVNGNTALKYLAKYDVNSASWTSVKSGGDNVNNYIRTIAFGQSGDGPYIGGDFISVGGDGTLKYLAKYDSSSDSWTSVKSGGDDIGNGFGGNLESIAFGPSGDGPYIGGGFYNGIDGDNTLTFFAKYDYGSDSWTSIKSGGDGIDDVVQAIAFHPITREGPYIVGEFTEVDTIFLGGGLAKWTGSIWTSINPSGDFPLPSGAPIYSIAFKQNGEGPYIGGEVFSIGFPPINYLAKYDINTSSWTSVKPGGDTISILSDGVLSIAFGPSDDGPYIGGDFDRVDGNPILHSLAKYDSTSNSWTSVKSGGDDIQRGPNPAIVNFISFSPSNIGPYIVGNFTEVGGETANNKLAYWQDEQVYKLTYNTTETLTLTNKGDNATLIYNSDPTSGWVKIV